MGPVANLLQRVGLVVEVDFTPHASRFTLHEPTP